MSKRWEVKPSAPHEWLGQFPNHNTIILQLLYNRGLETHEAIELFLSPDYTKHVYDPFLFRDMQKAVERIWSAIDTQETIVVYGDYDADGVCSSTIMTDFLQQHGATVHVVLPHRTKEGYGLNAKTIPHILAHKPTLVITVDCGTTNVHEVTKLREAGADTIIIDHHHEPAEKPDAYALLNCAFANETYPTKNLAAVGMAFKVIQGLMHYAQNNRPDWKQSEGVEKWYLDLVAIATVADCVPLLGENRVLVKYGLMVLNKTKRPGLQALLHIAGVKPNEVTERHIGFALAPRINAAGRMEHAYQAFELLTTPTYTEAQTKVQQIQHYNTTRQSVTAEYVKSAEAQAQQQVADGAMITCAYEPDWNIGIAGLVASRLVEKFNRPSLVMTDYEDTIKGSGRSIAGFNITTALDAAKDSLKQYGGHEQACGFTLTNKAAMQSFQQAMQEYAAAHITEAMLDPILSIDAAIPLHSINWELLEYVEQFAPFGEQAPKPRFVTRDVHIQSLRTVGTSGQHLKLSITDKNGTALQAIAFGFGKEWGSVLTFGDVIDIVYELEINEWNGNRDIQLFIQDLQKQTV